MSSTFGSRLIELRRKAGLSAERLAALLGLHRNSIVGYERDLKEPGIGIVSGLKETELDWVYLLTSQPLGEFVADHIQWNLIAEIWTSIEAKCGGRKKKLTTEQKLEVLKFVYRAEIGRRRGVSISVDDALRMAA